MPVQYRYSTECFGYVQLRQLIEFEMGMGLSDADDCPVSDPRETYVGSFDVTARSENRSRVPNTL
jgi:hypothetical protein